ncbi:PREDICTED: bark lectin-like [Tarenaya hassleriana]|uniref:bark lectin-like n=1 Tax=Tarenaya hassleriana TaxID=28532 RepID=UPI00053C3E72|nr:PREDICTED: bark lectin-like [Tarenaya hassleriana]
MMKNPNLSFPVVFLAVVMAAVSASSAASSMLLDTGGELLIPNALYYILPAGNGTGGGLIPVSTEVYQTHCPPGIVQSQLPYILGVPVRFRQLSRVGFVPLEYDINIEFDIDIWPCADESKVWKAVSSQWLRGSYVSAGGEKFSDDSWFQIVRDGDSYMILHSRSSQHVSLFKWANNALVLGYNPFPVKFMKADQITRNELSVKTM